MSKEQKLSSGADELMLFQVDSPVSRSALPVKDEARTTKETYGKKCLGSSAKLNQDGFWVKMFRGCCQFLMDGSLERFSETWHRSGIVLNGIAFQLQPLAPLTRETEFGLLPTPQASDATSGSVVGKNDTYYETKTGNLRKVNQNNKDGSLGLGRYVQFFPTPNAQDHKASLNAKIGLIPVLCGRPNPLFVEWLMGLPLNWSDCDCSVTAKSFKSLNGSEKE